MKLNLLDANKRRRQRVYNRNRLSNPERREAVNEARRRRRANPEYRAAETARDRERLRNTIGGVERQRASHRRWIEKNREHVSEYRRKHWLEYRERGLALNKDWHIANPMSRRLREAKRRARAGGQLTVDPEVIEELFCLQDGLCFWTGDSIADGFEVDHIVPLSRGGMHEVSNLALVTKSANRRKYNKWPEEFWGEIWPDYPA